MGLDFALMGKAQAVEPLYDYVMGKLEARTETYQDIAEGSGVPKRTVEKIARREIEDPGVSHVQQLADYFRSKRKAA